MSDFSKRSFYNFAKSELVALLIKSSLIFTYIFLILVFTKGNPPSSLMAGSFGLLVLGGAWSEYQRLSQDDRPLSRLTSFSENKQFFNTLESAPRSLKGIDLSGINLNNIDLHRTEIIAANFDLAQLISANLSEAQLIGVNLKGADLSNSNLNTALLSGVNLSESNLSGANLINATLIGVNLSNSNLSGANLIGVNLSQSDLSKAKVVKTKFGKNKGISSQLRNDLIQRGAIFDETLNLK